MCQIIDEQNQLNDYEVVFRQWGYLQIIEKFPKAEIDNFGYYLPHRPVIKKASQTMKIRPVFDASARENLSDETQHLEKIDVPRYVEINGNSELHLFVDACKSSYGACVYVRDVTPLVVKVRMIRVRFRAAPLKTLTLPRLELMACCIGARLVQAVFAALDLPDLKIVAWSDSMVAKEPLRLATYLSENSDDLVPLSPAMFLVENRNLDVPDTDYRDTVNLRKRVRYRQKLLNDSTEAPDDTLNDCTFTNPISSDMLSDPNESSSILTRVSRHGRVIKAPEKLDLFNQTLYVFESK
ncbi:integrase catalytic domain-containing protein [Trichonephila clavipes]|uniref:Integrase catalytic domain-containing protein n=1 Tax=Trichonephila clavipes TaxID=2585209 RepID=A0A8X7BDL3_TRICX|nr:integrase catalytic domain-containing protein [Trichonephila clavipes]